MNRNILILAGSPRRHGNSAALCKAFARGALESGNRVDTIVLQDRTIACCRACYYCKTHDGACCLNDDMADILDRMQAADVLVLASPVYFYSVSAQMKAVIDRTVARWLTIRDKEFVYIMTAAGDTETVMDCTLECLRGLARCLEGSRERGVVCGKGVYEPGAIAGHPALQEAYELGRSI